MGTKVNSNYEDLLTFTRASKGHALRPVSYGDELTEDNAGAYQGSFSFPVLTASATDSRARYTWTNLEVGKVYRVSAEIVSISSGSAIAAYNVVSINNFGTSGGTIVSGVGSSELVFVAVNTFFNLVFKLSASIGEVLTIALPKMQEVTFDQPDGTLTLFEHPNNIPRVEYDADGVRLGLLVEEARTNRVTYSEDFSQWTGSSDANQIVAPDGTLTATKARDNNAGGTAAVTLNEPVTVSTSTTYTYSVFGKKGQLNWMALGIINFTTPNNGRVWFDLDSGVVGTQGSGLSGAIEEFPNGWYRCSVTFTTDASDTSGQLYIYLCEGDNQFSNTNRDGTSDLYVWGAQLEAGSFPTSYIKTTGSTATRSADVASIPVADFGWNNGAGSFVLDAKWAGNSPDVSAIVHLGDTSDRHLVYFNNGSYRYQVKSGNTVTAQMTASGSEENDVIAASYKKDLFFFGDGSAIISSSSGALPAKVLTTLDIGGYAGDNHFNGHIKSIKYYPRQLTNAQLQALTEPRSDATLSLTFDGLESSFTENYIHG